MIAKTFSATVLGLDAHLIEVEVDVSMGLSAFNIVGLPDGTIKVVPENTGAKFKLQSEKKCKKIKLS